MYGRYKRNSKGFRWNGMEITKREILASVSIIAIMLVVGILISSKISEYHVDQNEKYNKAVKIESQELFQYGMETNIGNAFVYGELIAVDTVTYPEIGGQYMYIEKVEEHYNMHTRTYTTTGSNGRTQTHTQVYWSWDYAGSETKKCKNISFLGVTFNSSKFNLPDSEYIDTVNASSHVRYKYYGCQVKHVGTIFTSLKDNTVNETTFYNGKNIEETVRLLESNIAGVLFWVFWIIAMTAAVYGFFYLDNEWLEDNGE